MAYNILLLIPFIYYYNDGCHKWSENPEKFAHNKLSITIHIIQFIKEK